jgi:large subunit ribosomal protein L13
MQTYVAKPAAAHAAREWWVVDADGQPLGRLASHVAALLSGKHKPTYAPSVDTGDYVVVINAAKVKVTGTKGEKKLYYRHSGYPGSLRTTSFNDLVKRTPAQPIEKAVKGMLPKSVLGRSMLSKLKVYATAKHPHEAQQPKSLVPGAKKTSGGKS